MQQPEGPAEQRLEESRWRCLEVMRRKVAKVLKKKVGRVEAEDSRRQCGGMIEQLEFINVYFNKVAGGRYVSRVVFRNLGFFGAWAHKTPPDFARHPSPESLKGANLQRLSTTMATRRRR